MEKGIYTTPIQIRFKDLDKLGHVNNAVYLTYFEIARVHYFDDVIGRDIDWHKEGLILAGIKVDFKLPIFLKDSIEVVSRVESFGNKSLQFAASIYKVDRQSGNRVCCCVSVATLVGMNYETHQTIVIPERWKTKVLNYESHKPMMA